MKGVIVAQAGAEPKVVDNIEKPTPNSGQILVKSLWIAINPVDNIMSTHGILVVDWPLVLGIDASGVVVEAGSEAQSKYGFKPGDYVCGCTRLGCKGYSAGQEYFLMDAAVTIPKPDNVDLIQAATLGVAVMTAALGVFAGWKVDVPDPSNLPSAKTEWVVMLGGASSVGKAGIQLARAAGYKVIASCSSKSASVVEGLGAKTFDYKESLEQQVKAVLAVTGGNICHVFDAMGSENPEVAVELFKQSNGNVKYFSTTNEWSEFDALKGNEIYKIALGPIGRPDATELNSTLASYVPIIVKLVESGAFKASDYHIVGNGGFGDALDAYKFQQTGEAGSKKVVVKIQDE